VKADTELAALEAISIDINRAPAVEGILRAFAESVVQHTDWTQCWVGLIDLENREFSYSFHHGFDQALTHDFENWPIEVSPTVFDSGEPLYISDTRKAYEYPHLQRESHRFGFCSGLYLPITVGEHRALVILHSSEARALTDAEVSFARVLTTLARIAFQNVLERKRAVTAEQRINQHLTALNEAIASQKQVLESLANVHERLLQAQLSREDGFDPMCRELSQLLSAPVVILDRFHQVIASSGSSETETDAAVSWLYSAGGRRTIPPIGGKPQVVNRADRRFLVSNVVVGRERAGLLLALLDERDCSDLDIQTIEVGSLHTAQQFLRDRQQVEAEIRLHRDFMEALLSSPASEVEAARRATSLGINLNDRNQVIIVRLLQQLDTFDTYEAPDLVKLIRDRIGGEGLPLVVSPASASELVVIHKSSGEDEAPPQALVAAIRRIIRASAMVIGRNGELEMSVGVGTPAVELRGLIQSHEEASRALGVLRALGRDGQDLSFADAGTYAILAATDEADRISLLDRYFHPLMAYDTDHGSDLVETLETYFSQIGNVQKTAETMFVHISTVRYRLGRIEEILGLSLRDESERFSLQLALKYARISNQH